VSKDKFGFKLLKMNMKLIWLIVSVFSLSCTHSYYIVRHAEKAAATANMSSDVPLSSAGEQRAEALKEVLKARKIDEVYSTNTLRTKSTAKPAADYFGKPVTTYGPRPDSAFIGLLKAKRKNILVVGHSNTIDDIANMLCGKTVVPGDLPDTEYDNLFIIKMKGKKALFKQEKYGSPSH
jgi:broad specificity phosphatase PhoE